MKEIDIKADVRATSCSGSLNLKPEGWVEISGHRYRVQSIQIEDKIPLGGVAIGRDLKADIVLTLELKE